MRKMDTTTADIELKRSSSEVSSYKAFEEAPVVRKPFQNKFTKQIQRGQETACLSSTNMVFFKITDYVDFNPPASTEFITSHFLVFFKDIESFFDVALAGIILLSQIIVMFSYFQESSNRCGSDSQPKYIFAGVVLCALYAAGVATEQLLKALPYEVWGTTPTTAAALISKVEVQRGSPTRDAESISNIESNKVESDEPCTTNDASMRNIRSDSVENPMQGATVESAYGKDTEEDSSKASNKGSFQTFKDSSAFAVSLMYLYSVATFLQLNNILLILTVGTVMGSSTNFTDMISHFISVEIVVHVHEIVPQVLKMRDRSPTRFNKSSIELEAELEADGRLPFGWLVPRTKEQSGVYRLSAKMKKNIIFWVFFTLTYILFISVSAGCQHKGK